MARDQGKSPANSLGATGTCNSDPATLKELNPDNTLLSELGSFSLKITAAPAHTLIEALKEAQNEKTKVRHA